MTSALCGRFSTGKTLQRSHLGRGYHTNCTAGEKLPELMHSLTDSYYFYMASDLNELVSSREYIYLYNSQKLQSSAIKGAI